MTTIFAGSYKMIGMEGKWPSGMIIDKVSHNISASSIRFSKVQSLLAKTNLESVNQFHVSINHVAECLSEKISVHTFSYLDDCESAHLSSTI